MRNKVLGDGGRASQAELTDTSNQGQITAFSDNQSKVETIERIRNASDDVEVSKIVSGLKFDPFLKFDEDALDNGEMVYIMPMLQFPKIDYKDDFSFTLDLLEWLSESQSAKNKKSLDSDSTLGRI